jgi:hypothetical protein
VQGLQFVRVLGGLRPVEQLERDAGPGHDRPSLLGLDELFNTTR